MAGATCCAHSVSITLTLSTHARACQIHSPPRHRHAFRTLVLLRFYHCYTDWVGMSALCLSVQM